MVGRAAAVADRGRRGRRWESAFVRVEQDFDAIELTLTYRCQFGDYPGQ